MTIENTTLSLASLMGGVLLITQFVKGFLPRVSRNLLALLFGVGGTIVFWGGGKIKLADADPSDPWGWGMAAFYALLAVAGAMKAHDAGESPKSFFKRVKKGKVVP
jgi:hypothetical protein